MLDFDLTSPVFFVGMAVSSLGLVLFMYGKRTTRPPQLVAGITLMAVPYFVGSLAWLSGISAGVVAGLWALTRGKL